MKHAFRYVFQEVPISDLGHIKRVNMSDAELQVRLRSIANDILSDEKLRALEWLPMLESICKLLSALSEQKQITKTQQKELAFALFRIVTDDSALERSPVGERLMELSNEIESSQSK